MQPDDGTLDRRSFLKAAVATGGAAALSACLEWTSEPVPTGVSDPSTLPERQHAWNDSVRTDEYGNVELPKHQTLLYLTLDGEGPPGADARETVEAALSTLDRAYERSHEGLLYSVGYSPAYFDRYDRSLPDSVDLPHPRRLSDFEDPEFDEQDALLHLASDRAAVVLEAEEALTGDRETANGVDVAAKLSDAMTVDDRRTGFVGAGLPAKHQDVKGIPDGEPVPEKSPLFTGFKAGFRGNQATEDYVTIDEGPFAGGTTKHLANYRQRLADWYQELDYDERVMKMFSPEHVAEGLVEGVGNNLGDASGVSSFLTGLAEDAQQYGHVGHAQKAGRANRDEDGNVRILRRHFESTDDDVASLHFPSLQAEMSTFEEVRQAMNGTDLTGNPAIRQRVNNGILEYIFVRKRGNFLVPPRRHRSLPAPRPD
ncbi:MAG: twin-arginine translocation signal domain-containing protein [Haloferacaceae archaeon]